MKFTCKDISELISRSMDERLPFGQRLAIKLHVFICKGCRQFGKQMRQLRDAMTRMAQSIPKGAAPKHEALTPDRRARLESAIRANIRAASNDKS